MIRDKDSSRRRVVTTVLVSLACFMEVADEQITPSLFRDIGKSFKLSPSQLGMLTLVRALVQALSSPMTGYVGKFVPRIRIIGFGCILWGICTFIVGSSVSFKMALVASALNGVGLAVVIPSVQSILADYWPQEVRGASFGFQSFVASLGGLFGGLYATNLGGKVIMGRPGWRFVFHSTGLTSLVLGFVVMLFAHDPQTVKIMDRKTTLKDYYRTIAYVMGIASFRVIVLQGVVGSMPWNALAYLTLWFQLLGFSDVQASAMKAVFSLGTSFGTLLGGILGDVASTLFPDSGRILVAQTSVVSGIPLSILLFSGLPQDAASDLVPWYGMTLLVMGLSVSWCATCCNSPVFADIVPAEMRTSIYAFDRSFEGAIGALGTPLVGFIAEYGFGMSLEKAYDSSGRKGSGQDAKALSDSLLVMLVYPWTVCLGFYVLLHVYYKKDKVKAKTLAGAIS